LARIYPENKHASADLSASLGRSVQRGDSVAVVLFSLNRSGRWIEVLPPLLGIQNPAKASKKGRWIRSTQRPWPNSYHHRLQDEQFKLAPGERLDAAVEFDRPGFKYKKETTSVADRKCSEVDTALLVPVPFVPAER